MILHLLIGLLAAAVLLACGAAVALTWHSDAADDDTPIYHVLLALGWGFGLVPFIAFTIVLFTQAPLVPAVTLGVAATVAAVAGGFWWTKQQRRVPVQLTSGWEEARLVLIAGLGVAVVYLLKYDRSVFFLESCIHRVVMQTLQLTDNPIDILASNADDQRLGNTSVISSFVVLFRGMGFRVLYAFVGFIIAAGGWALGRRVLGSSAWGWFALVTLPLNPYVAKIPLLDENLLTLGYSSLFLPLILRRQVPWSHAGALFGLVVMMRHVAILSGPALLWAVWCTHQPERRAKQLWAAFLAFNAVTWVAHVHHYVALGSVLKFESFGQIPSFEHRLFGEYSGLLQWPLGYELVRTPWNPLPTFLMWPTYLADHLGLVLFAAMLLGVVWLARERRQEGVFWILWMLLAYVALSLQENWDVPNKMGVIYILFHPFILWAGAGLQAAFRRPGSWGVALMVLALATGFGIRSFRHLDVSEDLRYYAAWEGEREEDSAYVLAERDRVTDVAPWPDFTRLGPFSQVFHMGKLTGLAADLADPTIDQKGTAYGWFPGEEVDRTAPSLVIQVDLSRRLFDGEADFVTRVDDGGRVDVDLTQPGAAQVLPNLAVDWSERPVTVLLSRGDATITGLSLIFEAWGSDLDRREYLHERYHRGLQMVLGWPANEIMDARVVQGVAQPVFTIRVPQGPFSVVESVNNAGQNYLYWRTRLAQQQAVALEGPYRVFHN